MTLPSAANTMRTFRPPDRQHPVGTRKMREISLPWGHFELVEATAGSFSAAYTCDTIVVPMTTTSGPLYVDASLKKNGFCPPPVMSIFKKDQVINGYFALPLCYSIIMLNSDQIQEALEDESCIKTLHLDPVYRICSTPFFQSLWRRLLSALQGDSDIERMQFEMLTQLMLIYLLQTQPQNSQLPVTNRYNTSIERSIEFIDANLGRSLTLDQLSKIAGISCFHFARVFRDATEQSPHQYIIKKRLERACQLLRRSDDSIVEIALLTGFCSQSHFTTVFKRMLGVTPKVYRKDCQSIHVID